MFITYAIVNSSSSLRLPVSVYVSQDSFEKYISEIRVRNLVSEKTKDESYESMSIRHNMYFVNGEIVGIISKSDEM